MKRKKIKLSIDEYT